MTRKFSNLPIDLTDEEPQEEFDVFAVDDKSASKTSSNLGCVFIMLLWTRLPNRNLHSCKEMNYNSILVIFLMNWSEY